MLSCILKNHTYQSRRTYDNKSNHCKEQTIIKYTKCEDMSPKENFEEMYLEQKNKTGMISDGYHTFNELYEHRYWLFCALARHYPSWKAKKSKEGKIDDEMFIGGIELPTGQITYHLPWRLFDKFPGREIERSKWDGHTSNDVLSRLMKL